nr:unnamed protein product [Callosobruchus chinensis]
MKEENPLPSQRTGSPHFIRILYQTIEKTKRKTRSGFRKCGISPLSCQAIYRPTSTENKEKENSKKDSCSDNLDYQENIDLEETNGQEESKESDEKMNFTLAELKKRREKPISENKKCYALYNQKVFNNVFPNSLEAIQESYWLVVFLAEHGKTRKFKYYIGKVLNLSKIKLLAKYFQFTKAVANKVEMLYL